jgi:hypothetical protein
MSGQVLFGVPKAGLTRMPEAWKALCSDIWRIPDDTEINTQENRPRKLDRLE